MVEIEPVKVGLPPKVANHVIVIIDSFYTNAITAKVNYSVQNKEFEELLNGSYEMTEDQFSNWGDDNTYVENLTLDYLGLKRK